MTTRSSIIAAIALLLATHGLCSATENGKDVMTAENTVCDLGRISVGDGPQTCRFKITNNGSEEIEIKEAITSCGCTKVLLPEGPVAPGETVTVEVTYDNKEVTEFFDKRIALRFDGTHTPLILSVRGSTAAPVRNRFRFASRFFKFEKEEYMAGDVIQGCTASGELKAIYRRRKPAMFEFSSPDKGINVEAAHTLLRHDDTLTIHYFIRTRPADYGTREYLILASRKGKHGMTPDKKGIRVVAVSHADLSSARDTLCTPEMNTGWKHMALGEIKAKDVRTIEVPVSNSGNAELSIYKVDGECISGECSGITVKPGESRTLKLKFEPQDKKKGRYAEIITVYSNDAVKPEYTMYFTYDIKATKLFKRPHHQARLDLE